LERGASCAMASPRFSESKTLRQQAELEVPSGDNGLHTVYRGPITPAHGTSGKLYWQKPRRLTTNPGGSSPSRVSILALQPLLDRAGDRRHSSCAILRAAKNRHSPNEKRTTRGRRPLFYCASAATRRLEEGKEKDGTPRRLGPGTRASGHSDSTSRPTFGPPLRKLQHEPAG